MPAMRSNIACTWAAESADSRAAASPLVASFTAAFMKRDYPAASRRSVMRRLAERGEKVDQVLLLPRGEVSVGRHDPRADLQRAGYRLARQLLPDVRQLRPDRVAVVLEHVARQAPGLGGDLLALLVPRHVTRRRRVHLRTLLGAEDERHDRDQHQDDERHRGVLEHGVGEERLPLLLQDLVLAEVQLLLGGPQTSVLLSDFGFDS